MEKGSALKAFIGGAATWLGQHVAALVWGLFAVGGPILTWFASPTTYLLQLTRLQATAGVLTLVLVLAFTAWATRWTITSGRKFHLTAWGQQNRWGATQPLADGSINVQFVAHCVAKNLTNSVQRPIVVRLVRPRFGGKVLNSILDGLAGTDLQPTEAKVLRIFLAIKVAKKPRDGDLDATFSIANDEGHEERVKVRMMGMPNAPPGAPATTGAASTASPAATKSPSR